MFGSKQTRLCAAFFLLGACASFVVSTLVKSVPAPHSPELQTSWENNTQTTTGPCGKIEAIEIPLANPDGVFPNREERLAQPRWFLENVSESQLTRYLDSCDLRPSELRMLLDKRTWKVLPH